MKTILITGSTGYIGSHAVKKMIDNGFNVIGLDNLHNSFENYKIDFYNIDIRDKESLNRIFDENKIDLIMHFSGLISVPESVENPALYMDVNHQGTINLIRTAEKYGVDKIIFSSTAATYGKPKRLPILENDKQLPINPYGESKLKAEKEIINSSLKYTIFRYFNVGGSIAKGLGYFPKQKITHLIPLINNVVNNKENSTFKIFGNDYNTEDGTCVRDYIHVWDLVNAHYLVAEKMLEDDNYKSEVYNISSGKGYSVKEVYDTACKVHGFKIPFEIFERRKGDPDILIASSEKLEKNLGWKREYNLKSMIESDFKARFNT